MKYDSFALNAGYTEREGIYVYEYKEFTAYFKDWQYMIMGFGAFYIPTNKTISKEDLKAVEKACWDNVGALFTIGSEADTLIMSLVSGNKKKQVICDDIKRQTEHAIDKLIELGYSPMDCCPVCHEKADYHAFGDNYCPIHDNCRIEFINKLEKAIEDKMKFSSKHILSIVLSIIFACVGIVPAYLLAIFTHDFFVGIIALCPILAGLGYFLSKATPKLWLKIVTAIIPFILCVTFLVFAMFNIAEAKEIAVADYLLHDAGLRKLIFGAIISVAGFGVIKWFDQFKPDYKKELNKFKK